MSCKRTKSIGLLNPYPAHFTIDLVQLQRERKILKASQKQKSADLTKTNISFK